jgi:hypothetical protein
VSDSNRIQMSYLREVTWGTTPSSAFTEILLTGGGFSQDLQTIESATIRSDAQGAGFKRVAADASAAFNAEWSSTVFDEFIRGGIRSDADWATAIAQSETDISFTSPSTIATAAGDFTTDIVKGDMIYVNASSTNTNDGWYRVTAVSASSMTVAQATVTTESAGTAGTVTIVGQNITNGSTKSSYSLQQEFLDLTNHLLVITGARIGSWSMEVSPGAIMTSSFNFDGKDVSAATSKGGNGSVTTAASNTIMSEVDSIGTFQIDDTDVTFDVTNFTLSVDAENRPQVGLGSLPKVGMEQGKVSVTGSLEIYLDDNSWAQITNLLAFTSFNLTINWNDGSAERYILHLPKCYWTSESGDVPGVNSDKMLALSFGAEPGGAYTASDTEKTIHFAKVTA